MQTKKGVDVFKTRFCKRGLAFGLALLGCFIAACVEVDEHIYLNADGSGKVVIRTGTDIPADALSGGFTMGGLDPSYLAYPPLSEAALEDLFPGDDFKITMKETEDSDYMTSISAEIAFADINDLMAAPYGEKKSLQVTKQDGKYRLRTKTGIEPIVYMMTTDQDLEEVSSLIGNFKKMKADLSYTLAVTLPEAPLSHNGQAKEKTVKWSMAYEGPDKESQLADQAARVMAVSFSGENGGFSPHAPPRLALDRFADLAESTYELSAMPAADQLKKAANFAPCRMVIKRSFDISGLAYAGLDNFVKLVGAVEVPEQMAPQKWGKARLTEVVDDLDNNLVMAEQNRHSSYLPAGGMAWEMPPHRHPVTFKFTLPDRSAEKISRLKGEVELSYFSEARVLKADKVLGQDDISDMSGGVSGNWKGKQINHEGLAEAGIRMTIRQAIFQQGLLIIMLETKPEDAVINDIQAYDKSGRPVPTILPPSMGGAYTQLLIPGKPSLPVSLAFTVAGGGSTYRLPVALKDIGLYP